MRCAFAVRKAKAKTARSEKLRKVINFAKLPIHNNCKICFDIIQAMKAYITCPVSHTQDRLELLPEIKKVVEEKGIEAFVFKVGGTPNEIFERDFKQLESSDVIIAEVSERSHGVGIEIGLSYNLGLVRILLIEKGNYVSKLAEGMPHTTIVEYESVEDLREKLENELDLLHIS